jgi:high affinity Mn2+ porin
MEPAMHMLEQIPSNDTFSCSRIAKTAIPGTNRSRLGLKLWLAVTTAAVVIVAAKSAAADDTTVTTAPPIPYNGAGGYNWTGFYAGGNMGVGWGKSNWSAAPGVSGLTNLFQTIDTFNESGSFFAGAQAGYNYLLPNRMLLGAEVDASFPSFQTVPSGVNPFGLSFGGISAFASPTLGPVNLAETMLASGTVRGRIGYAPGHWLFYATGGFAWTYNQQSLTQIAGAGLSESGFLWRLGWAAGGGVEVPIAPHWTARLEYLYTGYGNHNTAFFAGAQPINSNFSVQELRAGLDYQFGDNAVPSLPLVTKAPTAPAADNLSFHGQTTFVYQGNLAFRAPYSGPNSMASVAEGRETFDSTLFVGIRPWQGAEIWLDPEIDQGHGLADTHGVAGFPSGEAYKFGADYPYARVQRYFLRQTIDLGGATDKVDADANQFAMTQTANRLVLTVGKFAIVDLFDTNKYANSPKEDFLNWSITNAGTFDYAGDAWGYTYGAAAEWYQGIFALRGGIFDMSASPAEAGDSVQAYGLDSTFHQFQLVGEIEERHQLWGQPGKLKITGFVIRGNAGSFQDAINLSEQPGPFFGDPSDALAAVRHYQSRPGVSLNLEQQVNDWVGVFARAGWADGSVEPWDFTDIDRTVSGGVSIAGKQWGRPNDTIGIAGVVNGLAPVHQAYFAAGGTGILIGDGQLPSYGAEEIFETYYSYAITSATKITFDYQFVANPAYATQRGPINFFAGRFHTEF